MPVIKHIVKAYGTFPVIRGLGLEKTLEPAIQLIKQGQPVGIFVEGKISKYGELREAKPGAAALAFMTGAPIIPVALKGTHSIRNPLKWLFLQKKVCVSFAKPIHIKKLDNFDSSIENTKKHINELTQTIHGEIKALYLSC
jgi:1-acyl-sn-glycerol-3-phosphate acyltransferase